MTKLKHWLYLVFTIVILSPAFAQSTNQTIEDHLSINEAIKKVDELGAACWKLRVDNSDSAAILGEKALSLAHKYNITKAIPRINNYLGVVYIHCLHKKKNYIPFFYEALEYGIRTKDSVQIAYAYNNLGDAYLLNENAPLSRLYTEKSLEIFESLKHPSGTAYGFVNMGLVYRMEKNYSASLKSLEKARIIREEIKDKTGIASLAIEIGKNYQVQGLLDSAMIYFQEGYKKNIEINNLVYTAYSLNGIANIHYERKQYDKAYEYFHKSIKLNLQKDNYFGLIDNYNGLALVCAKQNKKKEGEKALFQALKMSTLLNLSSKTLLTHQTFAQFYESFGDFKLAANSLTQFSKLYDSVFSAQQVETLEVLQKNFSIRQNLNKTQDELANTLKERVYLWIIIVLMLILSSIAFMRLRTKQNLNRQLHQVNLAKDKIFSVISHDLKTPFNSLIGFSELLNEEVENKDYANIKKYAEIIHRKSTESFKLLSNLLTWSQTQTGRISYYPQKMSLGLLFSELEDFFEITSNKNNVRLNFENGLSKDIIGDIDILRIVLVNLISNSFKYTKEEGHIQINATQSGSQIIISVKDTGIGIAPTTLQNLFKNNQLIESSEGLRKEQGTGLGLLISAELIQLHKGQISVESELGNGSVFIITLPMIAE